MGDPRAAPERREVIASVRRYDDPTLSPKLALHRHRRNVAEDIAGAETPGLVGDDADATSAWRRDESHLGVVALRALPQAVGCFGRRFGATIAFLWG